MTISEQDFKDYYIEPAECFSCREVWDKHALEAAWRLGKSGVARMHDIEENDPVFLNISSTPSFSHCFYTENNWHITFLDPTELAVQLKEKYQLTEFGDFNPAFCEELCRIFEENNVGFDVPCPYVPNWENQGKYPWPYPSRPGGFKA